MSQNIIEPNPPKAKRKVDPRPTSPNPVSITSILEGWKSNADAHIALCQSPAGASDGAWEIRRKRMRAQAILRDLADNQRLLHECLAKGIGQPLEWIRDHPHDCPLPQRAIESVPRCDWRMRSMPSDANGREQTIQEPVDFLRVIAGSVIPVWIAALDTSATSSDLIDPLSLSMKARNALRMLLTAGAIRSDKPCSVSKTAATAYLQTGVNGVSTRRKYAEQGVAELKKAGLAETLLGKGTWLTHAGCNAARQLLPTHCGGKRTHFRT